MTDSPNSSRNILLVVQYDGTCYCGWQRQSNAASIQQAIEEALEPLNAAPVRLTAAGRTDAGVHAAAQVVNFHTHAAHAPQVFLNAGNARLPQDIVIAEAREAPLGFSARRDARERWYRYQMHVGPVRPVFERERLWHVMYRMDAGVAREAARLFEGRHDFSAFRSVQCTAPRTLLDVTQCALEVDGNRWSLNIRCRSFLHNMVRIIAGTIVEVARGRLGQDDVLRALEQRQRDPRFPTAPAQGLTLMGVRYRSEGEE